MDEIDIYNLKREHGQRVQLQWATSISNNRSTGVTTTNSDCVVIKKAPVLPFSIEKSAYYGNLFGNFRKEAFVDLEVCTVLIDKKDIRSVTLKDGMWFIIGEKRYNVKKYRDFKSSAVLFLVVHVKDEIRNKIFKISMRDEPTISETLINA
jgi:hypothetical protein